MSLQKLCQLTYNSYKRKVDKHLTKGMYLAFIIVFICAYLQGADLIPSSLDETNSYGYVQRQTTAEGRPITEEQEVLLVKRLETLEHWWTRDPNQKLALDLQKLKKLNILSDREIDSLNLQKVQTILKGFANTSNMNDWITRFALVGFALIRVLPETECMAVLMFLIVSPFMPPGHILTTAGRHGDGNTWIGLRRMDLVGLVLFRELIIFFIPWISILYKKCKGNRNPNPNAVEAPLLNQLRRTFISTRFTIDMGFATLFYTLITVTLLTKLPDGYFTTKITLLTNVLKNQTSWNAAMEEEMNSNECKNEYTPALAAWLWVLYIILTIFQFVEIIVIRISRPDPFYGKKTEEIKAGKIVTTRVEVSTRNSVLSRVTGFSFVYWYFVLYYCPYDDAALPMLLECGRICIKELFRAHDADDHFFSALLQFIEVIHFAGTIYMNCEYPYILWWRIPFILNETYKAIAYGIKYRRDSHHVDQNIPEKLVDVYIPVNANYAGADLVAPNDLPGEFARDGTWRKIKNVRVKYETNPADVEVEGACRQIFRLKDMEGVIFNDFFKENKIKNEMNKHNLVYKKIRDSTVACPNHFVVYGGNKAYWNEAYQQFEVQELAKAFNNAVEDTPDAYFQDKIMFAPTAVMVLKDEANTMFGVEAYIPGADTSKFQKWSGNAGFWEHLYQTDNTPHTFTHFTWHYTRGTKMVTDVQGISASKFDRKYLLTDPCVLTDGAASATGIATDRGVRAMQNFHQSHNCGKDCLALKLNENLTTEMELVLAADDKAEFQRKAIERAHKEFCTKFLHLLLIGVGLAMFKFMPGSFEIDVYKFLN